MSGWKTSTTEEKDFGFSVVSLLSLALFYETGLSVKQLFVRFVPSKNKSSRLYSLVIFSSL